MDTKPLEIYYNGQKIDRVFITDSPEDRKRFKRACLASLYFWALASILIPLAYHAKADTVCTPRPDGGYDCQYTGDYSTTTIAPNAAGGFDVYQSSPGVNSGYESIQPAPQPALPTYQGIDMTMPAQQQYVPPSTVQPNFGSYEPGPIRKPKPGAPAFIQVETPCEHYFIDPETGESQGCAR